METRDAAGHVYYFDIFEHELESDQLKECALFGRSDEREQRPGAGERAGPFRPSRANSEHMFLTAEVADVCVDSLVDGYVIRGQVWQSTDDEDRGGFVLRLVAEHSPGAAFVPLARNIRLSDVSAGAELHIAGDGEARTCARVLSRLAAAIAGLRFPPR